MENSINNQDTNNMSTMPQGVVDQSVPHQSGIPQQQLPYSQVPQVNSGLTGQQAMAHQHQIPVQQPAVHQQPIHHALGRSEKLIGADIFRLQKMPVYQARLLQVRIGKTLGAPFIKFFGSSQEEGDQDAETIMAEGFAAALNSVNPKDTVDLIKDLCELTFNGTHGRRTNYDADFDSSTTSDLEVAFWVVQEQFGNFLTALGQSNLATEALNLLGDTPQK